MKKAKKNFEAERMKRNKMNSKIVAHAARIHNQLALIFLLKRTYFFVSWMWLLLSLLLVSTHLIHLDVSSKCNFFPPPPPPLLLSLILHI